MSRQRHLPDKFSWRGDVYAFHRVADGATLGRLDPYCADPQKWPLLSGRTIAPTGAEVRDITFQVHGMELPTARADGGWDEDRVAALERAVAGAATLAVRPVEMDREARELIEALKREVRMQADEIAYLMAPADPEPEPAASEPPPEEGAGIPEGGEPLPDPLASIPDLVRGFVMADETPERFTARMRGRYRKLHHMTLDMAKPSASRVFPDMTQEEMDEFSLLNSLGDEAVKWLNLPI